MCIFKRAKSPEQPKLEERTEQQQQEADRAYDSLRDELLKRDLSNTENYDRAILTLSASALGVSLTAIEYVVPLKRAIHIGYLELGWMLLTITIFISLVAYLVSNFAIKKELNKAHEYYKLKIENAADKKNGWRKFNTILNITTGIAFVAALCLVVSFVMTNLEAAHMSKDKGRRSFADSANVPNVQRIPSTAQDSANIPTVQRLPTPNKRTSNSDSGSGGDSKK